MIGQTVLVVHFSVSNPIAWEICFPPLPGKETFKIAEKLVWEQVSPKHS